MVILTALLAVIGYFGLGWWHPSHATTKQTSGGFNVESQPATLKGVLAVAHHALDEIDKDIHDYSAVIVKQERFGRKTVETVMFAKVREKPFSVYLHFLDRSDQDIKGREVIYVQGQNGGDLQVHTPGLLGATLGPLKLNPKGVLAMMGEHHPITEIGLANLCRQLIQRGESLPDPSQVRVMRFLHASINKRPCTLWEVTYPVREREVWGYLVRSFVDDALQLPIRVEIWELPQDHGKDPQLEEAYTYLDLQFNRGYSDADFSTKDPQYKFP